MFIVFIIGYLFILLIATLISIGFGYFLHWILPISLDTSLILGTMLSFMAYHIVKGGMDRADDKASLEEEDVRDEDVFILRGGLNNLTRANSPKKRRKY